MRVLLDVIQTRSSPLVGQASVATIEEMQAEDPLAE